MHQNALFLNRLASDLQEILAGQTLLDCFSTNPDEIYFVFSQTCIKGSFFRGTLYLEFPQYEHLPQKNRKPQFKHLHQRNVVEVVKHPLNRSFSIKFKSNELVFKCYGRNSNILIFKQDQCVDLFRTNLQSDLDLLVEAFHISPKSLQDLEGDNTAELSEKYRFLSTPICAFLEDFDENMNEGLAQLESLVSRSEFTLYQKVNGKFGMQYSELPFEGTIIEKGLSSTQVLDQYGRWELQKSRFDAEAQSLQTELNRTLKKNKKRLERIEQEIDRLNNAIPYYQIADIIMANLHVINKDATTVNLLNFYSDEMINISLKKNLSPQKNAEKYYKKGKNSSKESDQIESQQSATIEAIAEAERSLEALTQASTLSDLKRWQKKEVKKKLENVDPFRIFSFKDYEIWVGKNSTNNDQLLKRAHKDDLWLHARNVGGSHVLIRNHKKEGTPKVVIEYAASLAAYYSKSRNESLAEVIYTLRKNVRKFKGALAGQVKVEFEDVLLVKPFQR
jgi:predicted ribosome quality control (RQC) complex YloA/Tae2 family protein